MLSIYCPCVSVLPGRHLTLSLLGNQHTSLSHLKFKVDGVSFKQDYNVLFQILTHKIYVPLEIGGIDTQNLFHLSLSSSLPVRYSLGTPYTGCTAIHSLCDMVDFDMFGSKHINVKDI